VTAAELARIHAASFIVPRPWSQAEIQSLLDSAGAILVAEPQGFALGRALAGEAELLTIAVTPGARRQGLGRRLLAGFLAEAAAQGAEAVFLELAEDNAAARALYRNAGFARAGLRRGYYRGTDGRAVDAVILRRPAQPVPPEI
jgi:ribosomal-protein-alanine N-acetyltransferase